MKILLVEDHRDLRDMIAEHFAGRGFVIDAVGSAEDARAALSTGGYDVLVLDLGLPDTDGMTLLREVPTLVEGGLPTLVVTARDSLDARLLGLNEGADDYLVKPLNYREMLARIRNLLRRANSHARESATPRNRLYRFGGWQLDIVARELCDPQGRTKPLRSSEYRVLSSLLAHGNRVVSRNRLIELARGRDADPFDRSIDVRISRLRAILGDDAQVPRIIKTVHGEGYVIGVLVERG